MSREPGDLPVKYRPSSARGVQRSGYPSWRWFDPVAQLGLPRWRLGHSIPKLWRVGSQACIHNQWQVRMFDDRLFASITAVASTKPVFAVTEMRCAPPNFQKLKSELPKLYHASLELESFRRGLRGSTSFMNRFFRAVVGAFAPAASIVAGVSICITAASAADLGGDCCADLEERIAELEATTARKGNRKVSLTIAGQVHQAVLFWDDGFERNTYVVGNKNDQTNFSFAGDAEIAPGLSAGYEIVIRVRDTLSDAVDQDQDDGDNGFDIWQSHWWIESKTYGKVSLGRASRVTDTAPEADFSEAGVAGYAGMQDVGGAFFFRRTDGGLSPLTWGDTISHFNGDTADIIRYDTPEWGGFVFSVSYGEDDFWDIGARYSMEANGIKFEAVVAYTEVTDENGFDGGGPGPGTEVNEDTLVGSASFIHEASGLNLTFAGGLRQFNAGVLDNDLVVRNPEDAKFIYVKAGWLAKLHSLGPTAFYGEYGWFSDFLSAGAAEDVVASLSAVGVFDCVGAGGACRVTGNEVDVWGLGVVQHIEAAEMQVYVGYRHREADFDLVDAGGGAAASAGLEEFHTVIMGSKIAF